MKQSRTFWFWLIMTLAVLVSVLALRGRVAFARSAAGGSVERAATAV